MEEEWKDIANFEGLYQVSNLGRVKSLHGITLSQSKDKDGYLLVYLYANRKKVACKVQRIIIAVKESIKVCMDISGNINNDKKRSTRISSIKG